MKEGFGLARAAHARKDRKRNRLTHRHHHQATFTIAACLVGINHVILLRCGEVFCARWALLCRLVKRIACLRQEARALDLQRVWPP